MVCEKQKKIPMFVGLSGSITSTSIKDFWHLSLWTLKENTFTHEMELHEFLGLLFG